MSTDSKEIKARLLQMWIDDEGEKRTNFWDRSFETILMFKWRETWRNVNQIRMDDRLMKKTFTFELGWTFKKRKFLKNKQKYRWGWIMCNWIFVQLKTKHLKLFICWLFKTNKLQFINCKFHEFSKFFTVSSWKTC